MSSSVFKEYPVSPQQSTSEDVAELLTDLEDIKSIPSTTETTKKLPATKPASGESGGVDVVVVMNKDGSVSVDHNALHDLLRNDAEETKTSVSVVRVTSPTPSLKLKLEEERQLRRQSKAASKLRGKANRRKAKQRPEHSDGYDTEEDSMEEDSEEENDEDGEDKDKKDLNDVEDESDSDVPHYSLTVEEFYPPIQAKKLANDIMKYAGISDPMQLDIDYDFLRLVIQNDHCYTSLTSPTHREKSAKKGNAVVENSASSSPLQSPASEAASPISRANAKNAKSLSKRKESRRQEDEPTDNDDDGMEVDGSGDEYSDSSDVSASESDNDRDSDLDYNVNVRNLSKKSLRRNRRNSNRGRPPKLGKEANTSNHRSKKQRQTSVEYNSDEELSDKKSLPQRPTPIKNPLKKMGRPSNGAIMAPLGSPVALGSPLQKKYATITGPPGRTPKSSVQLVRVQGSPKVSVSEGNTNNKQGEPTLMQGQLKQVEVKLQTPTTPVTSKVFAITQKSEVKQQPKETVVVGTPNKSIIVVTQSPLNAVPAVAAIKRDRKTPAHVEALFSDMGSLFSTPDIIKKKPAATATSRHHQQIAAEQSQQLDLIDSIVQQELKKPSINHNIAQSPVSSAASSSSGITTVSTAIPKIVKMLETPPPISTLNSSSSSTTSILPDLHHQLIQNTNQQPVISINNTTNQQLPSSQQQQEPLYVNTTFTTQNNQAPVSGPLSANLDELAATELLGVNLPSADDGLTEEILEHLAALVENKNLQEIIDNHVNEDAAAFKVLPPSSISATAPANLVQQTPSRQTFISKPKDSPFIELAQKKLASKEAALSARKEPIQIVRSDGRVITLPPIEAPTTRGAKRRAQSTYEVTPTSSPTVVASPAAVTTPVVIVDKSIQAIKAKERRSSVASSSGSSKKSAVHQPAIVIKPVKLDLSAKLPDDYDDDDSDAGSYNSEDDPYRLWCVCRQPHNNRFMICCDKCEEWFHGKCVNVTKAMGIEMEERGIEWACPNCVKKRDQQAQAVVAKKVAAASQKAAAAAQQQLLQQYLPHSASTKSTSTANNTNDVTLTHNTCVVCKNKARSASSVYCSDECVLKHAETTINAPKAAAVTTTAATPPYNKIKTFVMSGAPRTLTANLPLKTITATIVPKLMQLPITNSVTTTAASSTAQQATLTNTTIPSNTSTAERRVIAQRIPQSPPPTTMTNEKRPKMSQTPSIRVPPEDKLLKTRNDRVIVFERKSGRCFTGNNAPTYSNLRQWLQEHPTFEAVEDGSPSAETIKARVQSQLKPQITSAVSVEKPKVLVQKQLKLVATSNVGSNKVAKSPQSASPSPLIATTTTTGTPKSSKSTPSTTPGSGGSTSKVAPKLKQTTLSYSRKEREPEPIRISIRKTFIEQLQQRTAELTDSTAPRLDSTEITEFAHQVEDEMFHLFNRDTGAKYKAKYRSLMFNIKDRKNKTLFEKICDKSIEPKQLVRMSPEELASQELAQWRENEAKHSLEMIKKSELDMLAASKSYVLKTHKGEEVMEDSHKDCVTLDPTTAVEDVVTVLNNSTVSSSTNDVVEVTPVYVKDTRIDSRYEKYLEGTDKIIISPPPASSSSSTSHSKKEKKRSRSRSRDKHDSSRKSTSSSSSKHKRKRSRDRRSSQDQRSRDTSKRATSRDRKTRDNRDKDKKDLKDRHSRDNKDSRQEKQPRKSLSKQSSTASKPLEETGNLIDQILEGQTSMMLSSSETTTTPTTTTNKRDDEHHETTLSAPPEKRAKPSFGSESDQEPTSTVTIQTPPPQTEFIGDSPISLEDLDASPVENSVLWTGNINMVDVATFAIVMHGISGNCDDVSNQLPTELDIVGRISPDTVWDYIYKIKKSPNKEIIILRMSSSTDEEIMAYDALYQYLDSRKRLGVVKTTSPRIKDFYVLPLSAQKSLPSVLQPMGKPGFGDNRTDCLLGIIVKIVGKRGSTSASSSVVGGKMSKLLLDQSRTDDERFTPPSSPNLFSAATSRNSSNASGNLLTMGIPPLTSSIEEDGDEPYSPGGSDEDIHLSRSINTHHPPVSAVDLKSEEDLQREMDELNRLIERNKQEIAGILTQKTTLDDEPYSPSNSVTPPPTLNASNKQQKIPALDDIAIPANLHEILASINKTPAALSSSIVDSNDRKGGSRIISNDEEYNPTAPAIFAGTEYMPMKANNTGIVSETVVSGTSKLAQMSEADLLKMIPPEDNMPEREVTPPPPGVDEEYVP